MPHHADPLTLALGWSWAFRGGPDTLCQVPPGRSVPLLSLFLFLF